jgi:DNA-binding IclR family transcriptional regulator
MPGPKPSDDWGTVARVVRILSFVADRGNTTIKEASDTLGLAQSTIHRMFDLLMQDGIVERDRGGRGYSLGPEFFRISARVVSRYDVRSCALPILRALVETCKETCVLSIYLPIIRKLIFAEKVDSNHMLRYHIPMNTPLSVLWGASGRSILAYLSCEDVDLIYASEGAAPGSDEALPSRMRLENDLATIRSRGYAVSHGQRISGAIGFAAPIFGADGAVVGSLSVTVPKERIDAVDKKHLVGLISEKATQLSMALGAASPAAPVKSAPRRALVSSGQAPAISGGSTGRIQRLLSKRRRFRRVATPSQ